jgi:restriction system protein
LFKRPLVFADSLPREVEVASVSTRRQREKDLADVRQCFTVLAACAGAWVWIKADSVFLAVVVFIIALIVIECLLLTPGIQRRRRLRTLGYDRVYAMNGEQFEEYLQALFQGKGYRAELTRNGADFGADLILERDKKRTVVQAKHWVNRDVGVTAVQEVHAARAHYKAHNAVVVTVAAFTQQAIELAKSCRVEMWDGERLQKEVLALNAALRAAQDAPMRAGAEPRVSVTSAPFCPSCGRAMVRRTSQYGEFWGCLGYPACRGTLPE